jgi:hypothetical protein
MLDAARPVPTTIDATENDMLSPPDTGAQLVPHAGLIYW